MAQFTGSRARSKTPRGVLQVDWPFFGELCRVLALKVFREYDPEVVIGIARAGVIPGAVVASILQRDFASIAITHEGSVIAGPTRLVTGKRVLLVDETCESGNTIKLALAAVREQKPAAVKTAVSFKTGAYKPRSEEHTSELQSQSNLVCRLLLEKKKEQSHTTARPSHSTTLHTIRVTFHPSATAHPPIPSHITPLPPTPLLDRPPASSLHRIGAL